jgi:hypothetical protein
VIINISWWKNIESLVNDLTIVYHLKALLDLRLNPMPHVCVISYEIEIIHIEYE